MNPATLDKLEFTAIREALAGYCGTSLGKQLARTMAPATKINLVQEWLSQVEELGKVAEQFSMPPLGGVHDVRNFVRASQFPTPLEPDALAHVAETLCATRPLCGWFKQVGEAAPFLQRLGKRIQDLSPVGDAIAECIGPRGEVLDHASQKLASLRDSVRDCQGRIRQVFDRVLRHTSITKLLQYSAATFHNDRMVLPLKAEYHGRIPGIIHRSSDSGATLFVEPAESVELNNNVIRLKEEETKEITRILRLLTQKVQANAEAINATLGAIAVLDLVAGKCRYAKKRSCVCPQVDADGVLELHDARHPLLVELFAQDATDGKPARQVVPIDVRLGQDFDVMVITGPNTGGKTVAIKTIGLMALMNQCGMPIPAGEGSRMPVYDEIHIDIGDEQSLQQSLSTFSSHLSNLLEILKHSGPRSLVLIDELGAGTDPDEGAAIGRAIVAELLQLQSKAVVSTHLSALKAIAFTTARVDNAAVEFDPESLRPTYRLRIGEPGNSNALIIAKRLGMPARLVQSAKNFLDDRTRDLNKAIAGTLASRREAEEARRLARDAALESQRERGQLELERTELQRSQEAFGQWTLWVNNLKPGDDVTIQSLKRQAKVVRMQLHKQMALVSAGAFDIEVPLRDLDLPATPS